MSRNSPKPIMVSLMSVEGNFFSHIPKFDRSVFAAGNHNLLLGVVHNVGSSGINAEYGEIKAVGANGASYPCSAIVGVKKIQVDDADDDEEASSKPKEPVEPGKESLIYWGYWVPSNPGGVTTTVFLHGTEISGSPFNITVEAEAEVFTSALPYARMPTTALDFERGLELICQWQTRSNISTPLAFSCAVFSDLGDRTETLAEGQRFSSTAAVENRRLNHADGNARALFIRPYSLAGDSKCIPIFVSCLKGDFSQIRKLVICVCTTRGYLSLPGYLAIPPRTETAFLAGICAKNNQGQWNFYPEGKFAYGRFITDLIPLMNKQITDHVPYKPEQRPFTLEKARVMPFHPNVGYLEMKSTFQWRTRNQDLDVTVLPYAWGAKGGKVRIDVDKKGEGIVNKAEKISIDLNAINDEVEAIMLVAAVKGNRTDETILGGLESATVFIRAANKSTGEKEGKSRSSKFTPSYYDLANFVIPQSEVGASASLVLAKIFRRSIEAPWELLPIGVGAVELTVDELLLPPDLLTSSGASTSQSLIVNETGRGLTHYVKIGWRPIPKHCKLYLLEASSLAPHPRTQSANPFVTLEAIPKSGYHFETKQSNVAPSTLTPNWNELFYFKDIGSNPRKDVEIMGTVWDYDPVGSYDYMGDFKINLKKCFQESVKQGGRSFDMTFKLVKGGRKKVGLSAAPTQRPNLTGEIKIRFLCC
eukprot:TRINITY_DN1615_c0_g1_i5.p2 TRINITY_DN1615_c0_g1~~TRINITY_DN1615_c0_g1_i5.p2  ORF type:complete len:703 (+),score=149.02 TRINITY_DN1615_c0_g1_i5:2113-4221(+)